MIEVSDWKIKCREEGIVFSRKYYILITLSGQVVEGDMRHDLRITISCSFSRRLSFAEGTAMISQ